jgi:hypothetical protein
MTLTFRKIKGAPGQRRADGEDVSYVISKLPKGYLLTVYSQSILEFKSDNTTLITLGNPVINRTDDFLRDAVAVADAFESSEFTRPHDERRRLRDAVDRAYRELGYTR